MRERLLLITALAIPLVLGATALWNLAGSAEPIQVPSGTQEAHLALARPVSGAQAPPTLQPAAPTLTPSQVSALSGGTTPATSTTLIPTPTTIATADTGTAQAPSQPTFAPTRAIITTNAEPGHAPGQTRTKGKYRG